MKLHIRDLRSTKDKKLKIEEIAASHTLGGAGQGRVQGRGKWRDATLLSGTLWCIGLAESATWARFSNTGGGGMGYLRRGKWIRDEICVSGRGVCVCVCVKL